MDDKIKNPEFLGDIDNVLHPDEMFDRQVAYQTVRVKIIDKLIK